MKHHVFNTRFLNLVFLKTTRERFSPPTYVMKHIYTLVGQLDGIIPEFFAKRTKYRDLHPKPAENSEAGTGQPCLTLFLIYSLHSSQFRQSSPSQSHHDICRQGFLKNGYFMRRETRNKCLWVDSEVPYGCICLLESALKSWNGTQRIPLI